MPIFDSIPPPSQGDTSSSPSSASLPGLMTAFNRKIVQLKEMLVIRNAPLGGHEADLDSLHMVVRAMEQQLQAVKVHLKAEAAALPRAKALIELSTRQEQKLKHMFGALPVHLPGTDSGLEQAVINSADSETNENGILQKSTEPAATKEKKARSPPPRCYITVDELDSLSSYMRGRLTLDKINAAVDEMAAYAEANARLLAAPRKKLGEDLLERVLELRDIASSEAIKGKHFFLESDLRGPVLKLDNTGKAILTVLRHLGRILEFRAGRHRALVLVKC